MSRVNILLVEDNNQKLVSLRPVINSVNVKLVTARSVSEAQEMLVSQQFHLLLVDIQIPNEIGLEENRRGGIELLEWVELTEYCYRPFRIVGVTSSQETKQEFMQFFETRGAQLFYASPIERAWVDATLNQVKYFCGGINSTVDNSSYDVAIITALPHNEFQSVMDLPVNWDRVDVADDPVNYYHTIVETNDGPKKVIAACCGRMGLSQTSALTSKMIIKFQPSLMLMTGITAGIRGKTNYGDIIIADTVWDWGSGKITSSELERLFLPSPHQVSINHALRNKVQRLRDESRFIGDIDQSWRGTSPDNRVNIVVGPVASGSVVLESARTVEEITRFNRDTVGIEMESYGFMLACNTTKDLPVAALVVKSVCDFGDETKGDDWQNYCCHMSANFAFKFVSEEYFNERQVGSVS